MQNSISTSSAGCYYAIYFFATGTAKVLNDCKVISVSDETIESQLIMYRRIQIYAKILNSCIRDRIFLAMAQIGLLFQILTGFAFIAFGNMSDYTPGIYGVPYLCIFFLTVICFSIAGKFNQITMNWVAGTKWICKAKNNKMILKSLVTVRIQFGNNFVDPLTPLVEQQFCAAQRASLPLMRG